MSHIILKHFATTTCALHCSPHPHPHTHTYPHHTPSSLLPPPVARSLRVYLPDAESQTAFAFLDLRECHQHHCTFYIFMVRCSPRGILCVFVFFGGESGRVRSGIGLARLVRVRDPALEMGRAGHHPHTRHAPRHSVSVVL